MSTVIIMARLQINWQEILNKINGVYLYEPEVAIDTSYLPAVYPVQLGRMTQPAPTASASDVPSAGKYIVERQYVYRELLGVWTQATMEQPNQGAPIDALAVNALDAPIDYFMQHPRLSTVAGKTDDLAALTKDVLIQDSGPVIRTGPGGAQYRAIDYTITIAERRIPASKRLS